MRDLCAMRRAGIAARLGHSMTVKTQHEILGEQELRLACARKNRFFGPRDPSGNFREQISHANGHRCVEVSDARPRTP